jgi:leucyl aminopeptidase (aminopeptidase T)
MTAGAFWTGLDTTETVTLRRNEPQSSETETQLPPIDAARIAKRVVGSLRPAAGERAILVYDPTYYLDLTRAMQMELTRAGVHPIIGLTFDPPDVVRALGADPARKREEEVVSSLRPVFEKADLFFWLPTRALSPDMRWERLLDFSRARGIHFHWITPPTGRSAEEIRTLTRIYERAILETDYAALSKEQDRLIAALRGQSIRITTPDGTDLRMRVPRDAWFHKNDGDLSPARARLAKSVRDREMEFPSGALRFIPDVASVEGKLVVKRVSTPGGVAEGVALEFERGRAVGQRAEKNESAFRAQWQSIGGDVDKVGEMVIGTNPLLVASLPSGDLPYYGYGAGYVRVSLGDNWESGGANRSPGGRPLWLFQEQASLEAGGKVVIQRGELVK